MIQIGTEFMGTQTNPDTAIRHLKITGNGPDGVTVIRIAGTLLKGEAATALRLSIEELVAEGTYKLAVDLEKVADIDSSGLGALASVHKCAREASGDVHFFRAGPRVTRALQITHLDRALELYNDEKSALSGF